jgi:hypothetical protein
MDYYLVGGVVLYIAMIMVSRRIHEGGLRALDHSSKMTLIDIFSKQRWLSILPLVAFVVLYFIMLSMSVKQYRIVLTGAVILIFLYFAALLAMNIKKLKKVNMPESYIRIFVFSHVIQYSGMIILTASMVVSIMMKKNGLK